MAEEGGESVTAPSTQFIPRYIVLDASGQLSENVPKIIDSLTSRPEKNFLKIAAGDISKGGALTSDNVSKLVTRVNEEAKKRAAEFAASMAAPAAEEAEEKKEEQKDDAPEEGKDNVEKEEAKNTPALEASYPFYIFCVGIVETLEDAKVMMDGFTEKSGEEEASVETKVVAELDIGLEIRLGSSANSEEKEDGKEENKEKTESTVGKLLALQGVEGVLEDAQFLHIDLSKEQSEDVEAMCKAVAQKLEQAHTDITDFREWRSGVQEVSLSGKEMRFECREVKEDWDAYPVEEAAKNEEEEKKDGGDDAAPEEEKKEDEGQKEEEEKKNESQPPVEDELALYKSRLAVIPEECTTVPIILHCLVEQVAANCIDNGGGVSKAVQECDNAQMEQLNAYFDEAMSELRGLQTNPVITKENENPVMVEEAHTLGWLAAAAMLNEKRKVWDEAAVAATKQSLLKIHDLAGYPVHSMSEKELSMMINLWPLGALGARPFPSKPLTEAERGVMRSQLFNSTPSSSKFPLEMIDRAFRSEQFTSLVRTIERVWEKQDQLELGKERRDWDIASRVYVEELSKEAMLQVLLKASKSMCGATRTCWRYSPRDDTVLVACHKHTPMLRKRNRKYRKFLYANNVKMSHLPPNAHRIGPKPKFSYDIPPQYSNLEREETLFFPADQGMLGMVESGFKCPEKSRMLFLEKDGSVLTVSPTRGMSPEASKSQLLTRFEDGSSLLLQKMGLYPSAIITTASGLRTEFCSKFNCVYQSREVNVQASSDSPGDVSEEDIGAMASSMTAEAEAWRCVFDTGVVLVRKTNGDNVILMPNGTVLEKKPENNYWKCTDNTGSVTKVGEIGGGGKTGDDSKKEESEKKDEEAKAKLENDGQPEKDAAVDPAAASAAAAVQRDIHVVVQKDSQSGATVTTREDFVMYIAYENGSTLVQHKDGTRIFSEEVAESKGRRKLTVESPSLGSSVSIVRLKPPKNTNAILSALGDVSKSLETLQDTFGEGKGNDEKDAEKNKEVKPATTGNNTGQPKSHHTIIVDIPEFGSFERMKNGALTIKREEGERIVVDPKGQTVYIPIGQSTIPLTRELLGGVVSLPHIPVESYLMHLTDGYISIIDREENFFKVSLHEPPTSTLSRDLGPGAAAADADSATIKIPAKYYPPPANSSQPRLFCIRRDGTGYELHTKRSVDVILRNASLTKDAYVELPRDNPPKVGKVTEEKVKMEADAAILEEDEDEDIEIEEDEEEPVGDAKSAEERGVIDTSGPQQCIKILRRLKAAGEYKRAPTIPNVVRSSAYSAIKTTNSSAGSGEKVLFPPEPPARIMQAAATDLPSEEALQKIVYIYRVITKQLELPSGITEVVEKNKDSLKAKESELKKSAERAREGKEEEKGSGDSMKKSDAARIQMAVIAARQRNHERLKEESAAGGLPAKADGNNKAKFLLNPNSSEPRQFFHASQNAPLQKVAVPRKFQIGKRAKTTTNKKFVKFFGHPDNDRYYELHQVLRNIFTQLAPSEKGLRRNTKGLSDSKKPAPDQTVNLHWLPEKKLWTNLHALEGFVKCLSRILKNPNDPTLRAVNLNAKPYSDALGKSHVKEHAETILTFLGFKKQGGGSLVAGSKASLAAGIEEVNVFLGRLFTYLNTAEAERTDSKKGHKKRSKVKGAGSDRAAAASLDMDASKQRDDLDVTTASDFQVHRANDSRSFPPKLEKQPSGMRIPTRKGPDPDKTPLNYRPVHYTVANMRRRRSLEQKRTPVAIGVRNEYMDREANARKRLQTSSTFNLSRKAGVAGLFTEFILRPKSIHFGVIRPGSLYGFTLTLKNEGNQAGRYIIHQPKLKRGQRNLLRVVHKPGAVAAGMSAVIEVQLWAGAIGEFSEQLEIQTETTEHVVPILANIKVDARQLSRARSSRPGHTRLVSRRMPVQFERFIGDAKVDQPRKEQKHVHKDQVAEPKLPDYTSTFNVETFGKNKASGEGMEGGEQGSAQEQKLGSDSNDREGDEARPIPDADEATAARSNEALQKKMLESMKNM